MLYVTYSSYVNVYVRRELVAGGSDQLESLSSFGHCAYFTFVDLCDLLSCFFLLLQCIVIQ